MESLSLEILEMITSQLPLQDAINFSMCCSAARAACRSRISPDSYLAQTFLTPRYLLAAMTDFGCVLSGSRALDYFVPGSASESSSDWDFLVPCVESSALGMMDALGQCGVKWEDPFEEVMSLITSLGMNDDVVLHTRVVLSVPPALFASQRRPKPTQEQRDFYALLHRYVKDFITSECKAWVKVEGSFGRPYGPPSGASRALVMNHNGFGVESATIYTQLGAYKVTSMDSKMLSNGHTECLTRRDDDSMPDPALLDYTLGNSRKHLRLINGYIMVQGTRQKVQLFQCHGTDGLPCTPLEFIINTYYATHVQCFISGWSAGHFFYDLARQKIAINWDSCEAFGIGSTRRRCIRKYRERGFRFFVSANLERELDDELKFGIHTSMAYMEGRLRRKAPANNQRSVSSTLQYDGAYYCHECIAYHKDPNMVDAVILPQASALSHEGYSALRAAMNPGIDQALPSDPRRASRFPKLMAENATRRLGDKGTLLVRFHRLQKEMWTGSICPTCCISLSIHSTMNRTCWKCKFDRARTDGDEVRVRTNASRHNWEKYSFRHYRTLCRSLDMFRWGLSKQSSRASPTDFRLIATEPILPHMARWHYPSSVSKFGNDSTRPPMFMDIAAEYAGSGQHRPHQTAFEDMVLSSWDPRRSMGTLDSYQEGMVSGPRAWSLRDIFAMGMLTNTVPNGDDNNLAGVSATAVAQACVPWCQRGRVRVRRGKRVVLAADQVSNGSTGSCSANNDTDLLGSDDDGSESDSRVEETFVVESREELWAYNLYLLTAAPGTCTEGKCRLNLTKMRPPQI